MKKMNKIFVMFCSLVILFSCFSCSSDKTMHSCQIVINEFSIKSTIDDGILDPDGNASDWVELYNWGSDTISLDGYFISDSYSEPRRKPLPPTNIPPKNYLVLWGGKGESTPELHLNFNFSQNDDGILIFTETGELVSSVIFDEIVTDPFKPYGCFPDGTQNWIEELHPTPLTANRGK